MKPPLSRRDQENHDRVMKRLQAIIARCHDLDLKTQEARDGAMLAIRQMYIEYEAEGVLSKVDFDEFNDSLDFLQVTK